MRLLESAARFAVAAVPVRFITHYLWLLCWFIIAEKRAFWSPSFPSAFARSLTYAFNMLTIFRAAATHRIHWDGSKLRVLWCYLDSSKSSSNSIVLVSSNWSEWRSSTCNAFFLPSDYIYLLFIFKMATSTAWRRVRAALKKLLVTQSVNAWPSVFASSVYLNLGWWCGNSYPTLVKLLLSVLFS